MLLVAILRISPDSSFLGKKAALLATYPLMRYQLMRYRQMRYIPWNHSVSFKEFHAEHADVLLGKDRPIPVAPCSFDPQDPKEPALFGFEGKPK